MKKENGKEKKEEPKEKKDEKVVNRNQSKSVDEKNKGAPSKDNKKKIKEDEEEEEIQVVSPKVEETKNEEKNPEELENTKIPIFNVSDEVVLTKDRMGIIRFKGRVPEMGFGIYYGVELTDGSVGHNDGQCKGVRYFQTEGQRGMFVGHEKIRRKMTARDHKRIDSFHSVSKNKEEVDGPKSPKQANQSNQDDEKESVLSPSEQERQRQESLAQREEQKEVKEFVVSIEGLEAAKRNENIVQFILRQNNKYRDILLDTYANPQTHITIVHAFGALQEIEGDLQLQGWGELIKRWQKFL